MDLAGTSLFPLKHTCRDLFFNIHDNELIWSHSIIPFPDVLNSKHLQFVYKLLEGELRDGNWNESTTDKIYKMIEMSVKSICNVDLIKKVSITKMITSQSNSMDFT